MEVISNPRESCQANDIKMLVFSNNSCFKLFQWLRSNLPEDVVLPARVIQAETGLSERAVFASLHELRRREIIQVNKVGKFNTYRFLDEKVWKAFS